MHFLPFALLALIKLKVIDFIYYFILYILLLLILPKRYNWELPVIPIYPCNTSESIMVFYENSKLTEKDKKFFELTDPSIIYAFLPHVEENERDLENIIISFKVTSVILFFKYSINRARPYQINEDIKPLKSNTGSTPSYPAGHAFQAYYLSHVLSQKYPEKKDLFDKIARKCDKVRVKAGIHYPSDGNFSKRLVDMLIDLNIY